MTCASASPAGPYEPWRGTFYPEGLPHKKELSHASRQVNSIEINGSFYSLQTPKSYRAWYDATPDDFVFSVKGSRYITHMRRLRDIEQPLANFFSSGILALKEKLGPILWQFPPNFAFDKDRFEAFFKLLPRDTSAAARVARRHDDIVSGRALTRTDKKRPVRHAIEVRHPSFQTPEFIKLLRKHQVALAVADTAGKWPFMEDVTADFIYLRLHGDETIYVSGYTDEALDQWAQKIIAWRAGKEPPGAVRVAPPLKRRIQSRDVHVYFDNDVKVRAPFDAIGLARRLGLSVEPQRTPPPIQSIAEEARTHWPPMRVRRAIKRSA